MAHIKNLQISKSGIFYLRTQKSGRDRKLSLRTRDINQAKIAVNVMRATIFDMKINQDLIKSWVLETDGDNIKIVTENNDADRASALEAVKILAKSRAQTQDSYTSVIQKRVTKTLGEALIEYYQHLEKSELALKTQKMTQSTLSDLVKRLGGSFNMSQINDQLIEEKWLNVRLGKVSESTVKRELSFLRGFFDWGNDKKRGYCQKITLAIKVKAKSIKNYDYFTRADLKLIFDNLPSHAKNDWQHWIPLIGLYTGARIGEIASLKVDDFFEKNGISGMRLRGTKTEASDRTIPIHPHLIALGLIDYATTRRNKSNLFDIQSHSQNGPGATASKWFTRYKQKIGLTGGFKVFHSFRPTLVDHLKQAGVEFEARCQYVGHDSGGGVHNKVYGRNELNLSIIKSEVVDKIDWQKYCGWELDLSKMALNKA
jgi:integrase